MLWINTLLDMNSTKILTATIFVVIILLKTIIIKWSIYKERRPKLPPGPTGLPIVGCLIPMIFNKPTFRWIHKMMDEMNTEITCIRLGRVHVVSITSPELAREFLKKHDVTFSSRPDCMSARLSSNGYLTAVLSPKGDQWKKMRRVLSSTILSPAIHHWLHDKRMMEADNLVRYIYNQCNNGGRVNVRVAVQHYCGNVIRRLIFNTRYFGEGKKDGGPGFEEEEHVEALITILFHLYSFSISDYVSWLEIFDLDGYKGILKKAIGNVTKYHDLIIEHRIEMWRSGRKDNEEDILDVLINLKDSNGGLLLTIEEIKAQIIEIMLAAIDNPSNAVEWCLAEMLNQPEILRRASEELDEVVGNDRLVQESDLTKLNYIKACVKEAFRLHPVAPFNLPHVSAKDTNVGSYFIPKGSHVLLSRPGLGRNPRIWKEASRYKPERHLNEDGSEVVLGNPELNMLSFSTGRRGCPAVLLGSTMATMLLARLIHGFTWNVPLDEPTIDLNESEDDLFLSKPLVVLAKPRLCDYVYQQLDN